MLGGTSLRVSRIEKVTKGACERRSRSSKGDGEGKALESWMSLHGKDNEQRKELTLPSNQPRHSWIFYDAMESLFLRKLPTLHSI